MDNDRHDEGRRKPHKLNKGQRRYRDYLETESSESFGDWLKNNRRKKSVKKRRY